MRPKNKTPIYVDTARARLIVAAVSTEFSVPEAGIFGQLKGKSDVSYGRQIAMYLMHCILERRKAVLPKSLGGIFQPSAMPAT